MKKIKLYKILEKNNIFEKIEEYENKKRRYYVAVADKETILNCIQECYELYLNKLNEYKKIFKQIDLDLKYLKYLYVEYSYKLRVGTEKWAYSTDIINIKLSNNLCKLHINRDKVFSCDKKEICFCFNFNIRDKIKEKIIKKCEKTKTKKNIIKNIINYFNLNMNLQNILIL